ncbi:hypothetical protein GCM10014715_89610 [Streptomyces spiralis]|uniref:Secreted protein n=1 Tax=Streptomyces spiralis TaxID=66376 RepID=A0A919AR55_9ACTN|nr:hypothetical protein [Streptomyces spiralis]GHF21628.1 hypothetical protein GCM10014715_89610 [Streptomyces spiralis]
MTRSHAITAGIAAAAALAATGITYATAAPAPQAAQAAPAAAVQQAPVQAPMGGEGGNNNSKGNEGNNNDHEDHGERGGNRHHDYGWIHINERSYSAHPSGCITVVSGLGSNSLNIRNDSKKTVEVFRGVTCDNGAPIATVGPHSESNGVHPGCVKDGLKVKDGVVASFRVVQRHKGDRGDY